MRSLASLPAADADAESGSKSVQTQARRVGFDADARTPTAAVIEPGRVLGEAQREHARSGREVMCDVTPDGCVPTRTTVAIDGMQSDIADIGPGRRGYPYRLSDGARPTGRFARKIDVLFSQGELDARYGVEEADE